MRKLHLLPAICATVLFACNSSDKKTEDTKTSADTSKPTTVVKDQKPPTDTIPGGMQLTATFKEFEMGDFSHFIFKDAAGKEWDFRDITDTTIHFALELPANKSNETNQGWAVNKALIGKTFDITYKMEEAEAEPEGPKVKVPVAVKVKMK